MPSATDDDAPRDVSRPRHSQAEKAWSIPGRASNGSSDGREAGISPVLPNKAVGHDGDRVTLALVFADEDGAGLETPVQFIGLLAACETVEKLERLAIEPAERLFLNPIGYHAPQNILRQAGRWVGPEHRPPARSKRVDAEGT